MRKGALILLMAVVTIAAAWAADQPAEKGEQVTITGHLSCTYCKLAGGLAHECTPSCCQACVKAGDPVLLQDANQNLYMLIGKEKEKPVITASNLELVGQTVTVKGMLVKTGGLQGIYVEKIEKAAAPPAKAAEPPAKAK